MGVALVYDYDYFHYPGVIPNLECAKLAAYLKKKRNVTVFHHKFEPERYTTAYFRKEYDDGIYNTDILKLNVIYGGRAFSQTYRALLQEAELIEPDFEIYRRYTSYYGDTKKDAQQIKTLLTATHFRLSLDGQTMLSFPYERLRPRHPCVILHDYDLAAISNSYDMVYDIMTARPRGLMYHIGNKYPINVYTFEDLKKWLNIYPMGNCFYLQYNGLLTDEQLIELLEDASMSLRQTIYNFTYKCQSEDDFVINVLPQIYKQALFLRKYKTKILLNIDEDFFQTPALLNLMKLINCWYGKTFIEDLPKPGGRTLYGYCSSSKVAYIEPFPWQHLTVTKEQMRESFQYIREHNYDVFEKFYSAPGVILNGGKLEYGWTRNPPED